jgi:hypothetical protein
LLCRRSLSRPHRSRRCQPTHGRPGCLAVNVTRTPRVAGSSTRSVKSSERTAIRCPASNQGTVSQLRPIDGLQCSSILARVLRRGAIRGASAQPRRRGPSHIDRLAGPTSLIEPAHGRHRRSGLRARSGICMRAQQAGTDEVNSRHESSRWMTASNRSAQRRGCRLAHHRAQCGVSQRLQTSCHNGHAQPSTQC